MLSNTSKYALRAVIYVALYSSVEKKVGLKEISSELGIPLPFLGKIMQMLSKTGILNSSKGPGGGFTMARSPLDIYIMEIIEIIDGKDSFDQCLIRTSACSKSSPCSLHDKIAPARKELRSILVSESIADLATEYRNGNERIKI